MSLLTTLLPWDEVWEAGVNTFSTGTTPATDGQTVQNWGDAVDGTSIITQATAGKRPTYRSSEALLNNKPCLEGERAAARSMQWVRGSNLTPPYTVVVVGIMPAKVNDYQGFVGNANGILSMWPWLSFTTSDSSESIYINSATRETNYLSTSANVWHIGVNSTTSDHRIGRNGLNSIPASFTGDNFGGFSIFRYPTSDILHGGGKIAFLGVMSGMANDDVNWDDFLTEIQSYYGIPTVARSNIIYDGDSRTRTYQYLDTPDHADKAWMHLLEGRFIADTVCSNIAVPGRTMATQITESATRLTPVVAELVTTKKIIVNIDAGYNDVAGGASASVAYQRVCDYVRDRHEEGFLVLVGTSPRGTGSTFETARTGLNSFIVANAGDGGGGASSIADGVVDIANDSDTSSANPFSWVDSTTPHNSVNYNADKVHFSTAGNIKVADLVEAALIADPFNVNDGAEIPPAVVYRSTRFNNILLRR